jgi:hypothetical protein
VPRGAFRRGHREIGGRLGKLWVKDENDNLLVSEAANFGTQQDAVARPILAGLSNNTINKIFLAGTRVLLLSV